MHFGPKVGDQAIDWFVTYGKWIDGEKLGGKAKVLLVCCDEVMVFSGLESVF